MLFVLYILTIRSLIATRIGCLFDLESREFDFDHDLNIFGNECKLEKLATIDIKNIGTQRNSVTMVKSKLSLLFFHNFWTFCFLKMC